MKIFSVLLLFVTGIAYPVWAQSPCDRTGPACETPMGTFRMVLPQATPPDEGFPAVIFFHGGGGSGAGTLKMRGMVSTFTDRGYAVIAPDGLERPNFRNRRGWSFHPERPKRRDEAAFVRSILKAAPDHDINPERVLMSGFSIGASLAWYLACEDAQIAAAYAPVGGAFWRPHPEVEDCDGPVRMLHTHGWRDKTVPLEGRPLRSGKILQGDVFHGLSILRQLNGCTNLRADTFETDENYWRRRWTTCSDGTALEFALHPGGHSVPRGWATMAINWFEALDAASPED